MTQKTRTALQSEIQSNLPSGNPSTLTAANLRQVLDDFTDSVLFNIDVTTAPYNADPTGLRDSTTGIQAAINALPAAGGTIYFPSGTYQITNSLTVGNGSSSGQSTVAGIYLQGTGDLQNQSMLFWNGSVASTSSMIFVSGPIAGWGINGLSLNAANLAGAGVLVKSAQFGNMTNVTINDATVYGLVTSCVTGSPTGSISTQTNNFSNIQIFVSNTANASGVYLTGNGTNTNGNTNFNTFNNIAVIVPSTATTMNGIYLKECDSNTFNTCFVYGGGASTTATVFDYSGITNNWPTNNVFSAYDPDGSFASATKYANVSSPGATYPNRFVNIVDANGAGYPKITGTSYVTEIVNPGVSLVGQTASVNSTNFNPTAFHTAGMYRVNTYLEMTTPGSVSSTISTTIGWTDDTGQAQTSTSSAINATVKSFTTMNLPVRVASATNVSYLTTLSGSLGTGSYSLYVKLEKLD